MSSLNNLTLQILSAHKLAANNIGMIYNGVNKLFRVTTDNKTYILKIFRKSHTPINNIVYERKITQYLFSQKIDCTQVISSTCNIEQLYTFEGAEYYGILTYESDGNQYSESSTYHHEALFGNALQKLHNCPRPTFNNPAFNPNNAHHLISAFDKSKNSQTTRKLKKIITILVNDISASKQYPATRTKYCVCHGDAWPGNALYQNNTCTLLDFEHARIFDPTFDVSTFIWWLTGVDHSENYKHAAWNSFVNGYGASAKHLSNNKVPIYIKTNQLRSLIFLLNNITLNSQIIEYAHEQTFKLLRQLKYYSNLESTLENLWKT
ncbi:phosphotransferase [Pseudomonas sp. REP124]|uniref:phosphotransferase n=1 Tax=Pseudomonas sp. REP124 TaxID=2875731 RepID=UPI001CCAC162|nr:phosphotransferase [Pseudomonas sp. REP124]MBZ9784265.1 phosphotransferase [Pseudomonas sp. REP124]